MIEKDTEIKNIRCRHYCIYPSNRFVDEYTREMIQIFNWLRKNYSSGTDYIIHSMNEDNHWPEIQFFHDEVEMVFKLRWL